MSVNLYLFLPQTNTSSLDLEDQELSWVYKNVNNETKFAKGSFSEVASNSRDYNVIVVLPGENVLFLTAEVPGKNIQRVRQALPYVLEDNLIDDVDELHFAISKTEENNYNVAVVNKAYLESINTVLMKFKIQAEVMTADYLLLKENNSLLVDGERVLYSDAKLKLATSLDNKTILDKVSPVKIIQCGKEDISFIEQENAKKETCIANPFVCLVKNSYVQHSINLLQGDFQPTKKWSEFGKRWLPAAAIFLVWLSVQAGLFVVDYVSFSQKNLVLKTEINKIYKKTFPNAKRIINAKVQMQQKLSALQKRRGQNGRSFATMLSGSAGILSGTKGLKIKSLRYYDGRINLELQIASLQELEKLKVQLNKKQGYQVDIKSASSAKNTVTAQLQITGAIL